MKRLLLALAAATVLLSSNAIAQDINSLMSDKNVTFIIKYKDNWYHTRNNTVPARLMTKCEYVYSNVMHKVMRGDEGVNVQAVLMSRRDIPQLPENLRKQFKTKNMLSSI